VGVVPAAGGAARDITAELDRRVQYGGALPLAWSADVSVILWVLVVVSLTRRYLRD